MDGWFDDEWIDWVDCAFVTVYLLAPLLLALLSVFALQTAGMNWIGAIVPVDLTRGGATVSAAAMFVAAGMLVLGALSLWSALCDHRDGYRRLPGSGT